MAVLAVSVTHNKRLEGAVSRGLFGAAVPGKQCAPAALVRPGRAVGNGAH